ncbi:MAG: hypothetical protein L6V85_02230 [Clostridiales bacterium]|nr:MAG: hypothetical protein L6V85_02230 [Clostridiales bacterium]
MSNKGIGKGLAALLGNMKEEETIAEKKRIRRIPRNNERRYFPYRHQPLSAA